MICEYFTLHSTFCVCILCIPHLVYRKTNALTFTNVSLKTILKDSCIDTACWSIGQMKRVSVQSMKLYLMEMGIVDYWLFSNELSLLCEPKHSLFFATIFHKDLSTERTLCTLHLFFYCYVFKFQKQFEIIFPVLLSFFVCFFLWFSIPFHHIYI